MQNISPNNIEEIYLAGGCLWGVQEFIRHLPGIVRTEAGRANGSSNKLIGPYDGYAEYVKDYIRLSSSGSVGVKSIPVRDMTLSSSKQGQALVKVSPWCP